MNLSVIVPNFVVFYQHGTMGNRCRKSQSLRKITLSDFCGHIRNTEEELRQGQLFHSRKRVPLSSALRLNNR